MPWSNWWPAEDFFSAWLFFFPWCSRDQVIQAAITACTSRTALHTAKGTKEKGNYSSNVHNSAISFLTEKGPALYQVHGSAFDSHWVCACVGDGRAPDLASTLKVIISNLELNVEEKRICCPELKDRLINYLCCKWREYESVMYEWNKGQKIDRRW